MAIKQWLLTRTNDCYVLIKHARVNLNNLQSIINIIMSASKLEIEKLEVKLNKQNAFLAALGGAFWTMPILFAWFFVFQNFPKFAPLMLVLSGILIGIAVRLHGRGYTKRFSVVAFILHLSTVLIAVDFGILLEGKLWAIILFGLYFIGAWSAVFFAKKKVPFAEHRAYFELMEKTQHVSLKKWCNRWFVAMPSFLISMLSIHAMTTLMLVFVIEEQALQAEIVEANKQKIAQQNKEIDVTPGNLKTLTVKQSLLYAHAYFNGHRFTESGRYEHDFPTSEYKSKTILKYLAHQENNSRALFVLGVVDKNKVMIDKAAELGDSYAKLYSILDFGCNGDPLKVIPLLNGLYSVTKEQAIKSEINTIHGDGFSSICEELSSGSFEYSFVRDYKTVL